ncbi:MAG: chloramphenicol acetyltransferase [Bacillota bacterium]|nr:MAG: chloramphenicol acetyltransferase [Bacillota bacterium]
MKEENFIPNPDALFPNEYKTSCFIKNAVKAKNVFIGDYTYYDDVSHPEEFEKNNILFNWEQFGDKLVIGKFCAIGSGTKFMMGPCNHRTQSVSTYPFAVFGGAWEKAVPPHLAQLPKKGDIVVGNDVWFGKDCLIMSGVTIGDGAIIAARSLVTSDVPPYTVYGGNPAKFIKRRFDEELVSLLLQLQWWNLPADELVTVLPLLCDFDLEKVKRELSARMKR